MSGPRARLYTDEELLHRPLCHALEDLKVEEVSALTGLGRSVCIHIRSGRRAFRPEEEQMFWEQLERRVQLCH